MVALLGRCKARGWPGCGCNCAAGWACAGLNSGVGCLAMERTQVCRGRAGRKGGRADAGEAKEGKGATELCVGGVGVLSWLGSGWALEEERCFWAEVGSIGEVNMHGDDGGLWLLGGDLGSMMGTRCGCDGKRKERR